MLIKVDITRRFEAELLIHKEEILNFQQQIEDTKASYDKIIENLQIQHEEILKQKRREIENSLKDRGNASEQRIQMLEQELKIRFEQSDKLYKDHQLQLETLSGMLDQAKEKERQKNSRINELTNLLAEESQRADKLRQFLQQAENEKQRKNFNYELSSKVLM